MTLLSTFGLFAVTAKLVLIKQGSDVHTSTLNQMIVLHFVSRHFHSHMTTVRMSISSRND